MVLCFTCILLEVLLVDIKYLYRVLIVCFRGHYCLHLHPEDGDLRSS